MASYKSNWKTSAKRDLRGSDRVFIPQINDAYRLKTAISNRLQAGAPNHYQLTTILIHMSRSPQSRISSTDSTAPAFAYKLTTRG